LHEAINQLNASLQTSVGYQLRQCLFDALALSTAEAGRTLGAYRLAFHRPFLGFHLRGRPPPRYPEMVGIMASFAMFNAPTAFTTMLH